jgi:hypothetical protein
MFEVLVKQAGTVSPEVFKSAVVELEYELLEIGATARESWYDPKLDDEMFPITNHFADGLYGREIFMPAGSMVTGLIHKFQHLVIILTGKARVVNEFGYKYLEAPSIFISNPGTKNVIYVEEDMRWLTVHPAPEDIKSDAAKLLQHNMCATYTEYADYVNGTDGFMEGI